MSDAWLLRDLMPDAGQAGAVMITGLTADSREVQPGFLFAALRGENHNGEDFIDRAVAAGAGAVLAGPGVSASVPVVNVAEPRLALAAIAARYYPDQPGMIAGVTGTNGKTSIARFTQQLWSMLGHQAGSIGTLGAFSPGYEYTLRHTTPHPVEVHQVLSTMARLGTSHVAMEISSHGLAQYRADGVRLSLAAFTNITRDHLDYHSTFEDYFEAKIRLLTELLPEGGTAVINMDGAGSPEAAARARATGRKVFEVGRDAADISMIKSQSVEAGTDIIVKAGDLTLSLSLPLIGAFQAENALVAAGLVVASGHDVADVLPLLEKLEGAPGRMQLVGTRRFEGGFAGVYVDYAHTPDALTTILKAARPHCSGRLHLVFGAGGDRDVEKRPLMGTAAGAGADLVIVTDDNPRTEDAASIRAGILSACPDAREIGDREEAIRTAINGLAPGDILILAGKGHEAGQTIGTVTHPFNDGEVAQRILADMGSADDGGVTR